MGFGQREVSSLFTPGRLAGIFGPMLSHWPEKLGTRIEIVEAHDAIYADGPSKSPPRTSPRARSRACASRSAA
ncbi:MAG: hypothetical protein R3E53_02735 [Myxococcota bacterium]